ncbi:hypothetical protein SteCoe_10143 [Stentor coeruleus]|uniref:Uncharacterized protein n=1 Tax=Stentor coeruleus TaxID=5963 RepID=A0A1R2CGB9_9CILI|nr:hypothetical protein SteCoe_10143 [Stentor coeruleus]
MEGTETLILLEEVLGGKIHDPKIYATKTSTLHLMLASSPACVVRASGMIATRLKQQKKINDDNYNAFQKYIQEILSGKRPKSLQLAHSGYTDDLAQKASKLIFGLSKLQKLYTYTLLSSFFSLKLYQAKFSVSSANKHTSCYKFFILLSKKYQTSTKKFFQTWKYYKPPKEKPVSGKFRERQLKYQCIRKILRLIKPSFEPIAYWRWKIKISDYKEIKIKFIKAMTMSERLLRFSLKKNHFRKWNFVNTKMKKISKFRLGRALSIAKTKYFFLNFLTILKWKNSIKKPQKKEIGLNLQKSSKHKLRACKSDTRSKEKVLGNVIRISTVRYQCLKHTSFMRFYFNCLLEETISEIHHSKITKRKRKRIINSLLSNKGHNNEPLSAYSVSLKSPEESLKRVLRFTNVRYFYTFLMFFKRWTHFKRDESFSEEEHHHVIKRKKILSPRNAIIPMVQKEVDDTIEELTCHTAHLKGISKPTRNALLRSSKRKQTDDKAQLQNIINFLNKISISKKKLFTEALKIWIFRVKEHEKFIEIGRRIVYSLIRRRNMNKKSLRIAMNAFFENKKKKVAPENISKYLNILVHKALEVKNAKKFIILLWKEKIRKMGSIKIFKLAVRSLMKIRKAVMHPWLGVWKKILGTTITKCEVLEMVKVLNNALGKSIENVIKKQITKRSIENAKTGMGHVKTMMLFGRIYGFMIKRIRFGMDGLMKWTKGKKVETRKKLKNMIAIVLKTFCKNGRRVFRPIREYKNRDVILKRAIRKIRSGLIIRKEILKYLWNVWKLNIRNIKFKSLFSTFRTVKLRSALSKLANRMTITYFQSFKHISSLIDKNQMLKYILQSISKRTQIIFLRVLARSSLSFAPNFLYLINRILMRTKNTCLSRIISKTGQRLFSKLNSATLAKMSQALEKIKKRSQICKLIQKLNSAFILIKIFKKKTSDKLAQRFKDWKHHEALRRKILLKKYVMMIIFKTSLCYETILIRWRYIISHDNLIPVQKNVILIRRMTLATANYINRLKQFALFKLVMYSTFFPDQSKHNSMTSIPAPNLSMIKTEESELPSFMSSGEKSPYEGGIFSMSTAISSRITKDEIHNISQIGALEYLIFIIKSAVLRRIVYGITSIEMFSKNLVENDEEREGFFEEINALRYDKHSLLEDNASLRLHNEALIENLERTNAECLNLSELLKETKISRMVALLGKMIEVPVVESLYALKSNSSYRY